MDMFGTRRLDDHIRACDRRAIEVANQHREMRESIRDLSEQTRGEFRVVREETSQRHTENRRLMYGLAGAIIVAVLTNYLAAHGFRSPAISGDTTASTDSIKTLKSLLEQVLVEQKAQPPVAPLRR